MNEIEQIPWIKALRKIDYNFNSIGATSMTSINTEFGRLDFHWEGNQTKIKLTFVNSSFNCICENPTIVSCDCDWIAFQEGPASPFKIFTQAQVEKLLQLTLF